MKFKSFPLALVLIIIWSILRIFNIVNFSVTSAAGLILACLCFATIIFEFYKSGDDVTRKSFGRDMIASVVETILATVALTLAFSAEQPSFYLTDIFMAVLVFADAWFSPYNSFNIALRRVEASVNTASPAAQSPAQ